MLALVDWRDLMYSREEIKALTDKVLDMTKADGVDVSFDGSERSARRWANSSITVNLVQYDQQLTVTVRHGEKQGAASTREFDDESLKAMIDEAQETAAQARDNANLPPLVKGPRDYITVDAVAQKTRPTASRTARRTSGSRRLWSARPTRDRGPGRSSGPGRSCRSNGHSSPTHLAHPAYLTHLAYSARNAVTGFTSVARRAGR